MSSSNSESEAVPMIFLIVAIVAGFISCTVAGCQKGTREQREAAIKAGVAHWTVDEKTGETKFEYLTPKEAE